MTGHSVGYHYVTEIKQSASYIHSVQTDACRRRVAIIVHNTCFCFCRRCRYVS